MKAQKSDKYDYITALASARKFHDVGKKYLDQWAKTGHLSATDAFVSATNYGLALELYLKSLLIMEGATEIKGHHLDFLFEKLSDDTKREITRAYQNAGGLERKEAFYIRGRLTGSNVDEATGDHRRRCVRGVDECAAGGVSDTFSFACSRQRAGDCLLGCRKTKKERPNILRRQIASSKGKRRSANPSLYFA